jgi:hypothetical protein
MHIPAQGFGVPVDGGESVAEQCGGFAHASVDT